MKLQKFSKSSTKKKKMLAVFSIIVCLLIVGFAIFRTYAMYQEDKTYNVLRGKVGEFMEGGNDITIAVVLNGEKKSTFPKKYDGYKASGVTCSRNAVGSWNEEDWKLEIENLEETNTLCTVSFTRYEEEILNGAAPQLVENLIPVIIADDGTVTKADTQEEWYKYADQTWANAVILEDETITYENGATIPESNIESYFVWIPRYKYKIWNLGTYTSLSTIDTSIKDTIDIVFGTDTTSDSNSGECTTPMLSGETGGCAVGEFMTHPAFISFDVNGMWVGKFESGYKGATSTSGAQSNTNNSEKLQVKPNVYSWRSIQVANAHLTSYNYKRDMDSHMMKNTEWGAVAYLQHSIYGSRASVRINNNSSYLTGYAGVVEPTTGYTATNISCSTTPEACNEYGTSATITQPYNTETGYLASTTGNISGIYDMSGGAWEYMMGALADSSGNPMSGRHNVYNSGFLGTYGCPTCDTSSVSGVDSSIKENTTGKEWPEDAKYYDLYKYQTSASSFKNRILGDATAEMGPFQSKTYGTQTRQIGSWYDDEGWFVIYWNTWFARGAAYYNGSEAGVFSFSRDAGHANSWFGFRVVLAV